MKQITLSGIVGWDITAENIRHELANASGDPVELVISSSGGLISECLEIANLVRNYPGHVTARLSGFAMSAASYIPLFADKVIAEDNAVYMIHNVQGGVWGDHNYILKYGNVIRDLSLMMGRQYVHFSGIDAAEITAMLDEETYFHGQGIVDAGFAHELAATGSDSGDDQASALAVARTTFAATAGRLAADIQATAADLNRAVALAPNFTSSTNNRATAPANNQLPRGSAATIKEPIMDLKTLKEKHTDLVAAITEEATAHMNTLITAARAESLAAGAEQERQRIADVRAQLIPGHETLIETMAADGKSTGADAAKAIVVAEKALRIQVAQDLQNSANQAVPPAKPPAEGAAEMSREDFNKLGAKAQAEFIEKGGVIKDKK